MAKRTKKSATELTTHDVAPPIEPSLLGDVRQLIETARQQTARAVNAGLVMRSSAFKMR